MANKKNLANGQLASSLTSSATTLAVVAGQGARFLAAEFYATITPESEMSTTDNSEVVRVSSVTDDSFTIQRAQMGTTAKEFDAGAIIAIGIYVNDVIGTDVTVATAATTAAKVGTTTAGNYVPTYGDRVNVTFTLGMNVASPTLNIDGSGAKAIRIGNTAVTTSLIGTTSALVLQLWYDGTYWQASGSHKNDNTTYTEISDAEAANAASSTARLISGRRLQTALTAAFAAVTGFVRSSTTARLTVSSTAPSSPATGDIWIDTNDLPEDLAPSSIVFKEVPSGTINGTNKAFTTAQPYVAGTLNADIRGVGQDFTIVETSPGTGGFEFSAAPEVGDELNVWYQVRVTATGNADTLDGYHANATPTPNNLLPLSSGGSFPSTVLKNPCMFSVYRQAAASQANDSKIIFDTVEYNVGSCYSTTTGVFTAPIAGVYTFSAQMTLSAYPAGQYYWTGINKNGSPIKRLGRDITYASSNPAPNGTFDIKLAAGDTIDVRAAIGSSPANLEVGSSLNTWFTGRFVSLP